MDHLKEEKMLQFIEDYSNLESAHQCGGKSLRRAMNEIDHLFNEADF